MVKKKVKKTFSKLRFTIIILIIFIGGNAFYALIDTSVNDFLMNLGLTNFYLRAGSIVVLSVVILTVLGFKLNKALNKIFIS